MSSDVLAVFDILFGPIWSIFTSVTIPGTRVTLGSFLLFLVVACISLRFLKHLFEMSGGGKF